MPATVRIETVRQTNRIPIKFPCCFFFGASKSFHLLTLFFSLFGQKENKSSFFDVFLVFDENRNKIYFGISKILKRTSPKEGLGGVEGPKGTRKPFLFAIINITDRFFNPVLILV